MLKKYRPVIGLEVHVELGTRTKMFCSCSANHFLAEPNTNVCPICMGLPGAMPYANKKGIMATIKAGLAFGCEINSFSKFDRKHYYYPDLPKGYQISQYELPICKNGYFDLKESDSKSKKIRIRRIHLEEDTGKLVHRTLEGRKGSLIDYNRSGGPLLEMVTEPDFESANEVDLFLREVQLAVRYLDISGANMEQGSMRLEANVSLCKEEDVFDLKKGIYPDYKVELKNINSFRFLKKALEFEFERQAEILSRNEKVVQETRGFDEVKAVTFSQRVKEEAQDYRYFPEPDIPPLTITEDIVEQVQKSLPELPSQRRERLMKDYFLSSNYTELLVSDLKRAEYFERAVILAKEKDIEINKVVGAMINQNLDIKFSEPAGLIKYLLEIKNKAFVSADEVVASIDVVIHENQQAVLDYQSGKEQILGFLIGQVQRKLKGKGEASLVSEKIKEKLKS